MKDGLTEIAFVIDRSASMSPLTEATINGFNSFIDEQRTQPGEATVTMTLFNHVVDIEARSVPLDTIKKMDYQTYRTGGNTAMNDAIAMTINDVGERLSVMDESDRPSKVVVVIITDGEENHSKIYTRDQVADMIKHQKEKYGWDFVFMGANIDVQATAMSMNIDLSNAGAFAATTVGVAENYRSISRRISTFRGN